MTAFAIAKLRQTVFVVEQFCPYPDLDDLDVHPTTTQWWVPGNASWQVCATLRVMDEVQQWRIGRVATEPACRSHGYASLLMKESLEWIANTDATRPIVLDAQARLETWYEGFGFVVSGPRFFEDGIEHTPMLRPPPN